MNYYIMAIKLHRMALYCNSEINKYYLQRTHTIFNILKRIKGSLCQILFKRLTQIDNFYDSG